MTINGTEYTIIDDHGPDEKLGYRELPHGQVEIMSMFCGEVKLNRLHVADLQKVVKAMEGKSA